MKKTVNVNIGSISFVMDHDAFTTLDRYLGEIRARLVEDNADEIMNDIEARIAEIFSEKIRTPSQVVDIETARYAMSVIGRPELFGEKLHDTAQEPPRSSRKLYRSRGNAVIGGVCSGLADYLNMDPTLLRVVMFLLVLIGGMSLWIYIIMWIIIPTEPLPANNNTSYYERKNR